jgi:hypothetical protein
VLVELVVEAVPSVPPVFEVPVLVDAPPEPETPPVAIAPAEAVVPPVLAGFARRGSVHPRTTTIPRKNEDPTNPEVSQDLFGGTAV